MSRLQAGQLSTWTFLLWSHAVAIAAVCSSSSSCWNMQGLPWKSRCLDGSICIYLLQQWWFLSCCAICHRQWCTPAPSEMEAFELRWSPLLFSPEDKTSIFSRKNFWFWCINVSYLKIMEIQYWFLGSLTLWLIIKTYHPYSSLLWYRKVGKGELCSHLSCSPPRTCVWLCLWLCESNEKSKKYSRRQKDGGVGGGGQHCLSALKLQQLRMFIVLRDDHQTAQ